MTKIIPSTDLRNKYSEISNYCHETGNPIFITKNGRNDLVIMSPLAFEHFEYDRIDKMVAKKFEEKFYQFFDLKKSIYSKIDQAMKEIESGNGIELDEVVKEMEGNNDFL